MPTFSTRRSYSPETYTYTYTPPTPGLSKSVGFASNPVSSFSRPLTSTEHRPLYDFEMHARACRSCNNPLDVHRSRGRLCSTGTGLASGVTSRLYSSRDGSHIAARGDASAHVELPHTYPQAKSLLRAAARAERTDRPALDRTASLRTDERSRRASRVYDPAPSSYSPPRTGRTRSTSFRSDERMPSLTRSPSPAPRRTERTSDRPASSRLEAQRAAFWALGNPRAGTESLSHGLASLAVRSQTEDLSSRMLRESPVAPTFGRRASALYGDYESVARAPRRRGF